VSHKLDSDLESSKKRNWDTDVLVLTLEEEAITVAHALANRWTGSTFYAFFSPEWSFI